MNEKYVFIPNTITFFRVFLIFPIFFLLEKNLYEWALTLTSLAIFFDFIDGQVARKLDCTTLSGSILDPVADKIFVLCIFFFFTSKDLLNATYFVISSTRDVLQLLAIPVLMGYKRIRFKVIPSLIAKIATAINYIIIVSLFLIPILHLDAKFILLPMIIISAALEVYILYNYLIRFFQIYKGFHDTFE